jgi:hypothetical protein
LPVFSNLFCFSPKIITFSFLNVPQIHLVRSLGFRLLQKFRSSLLGYHRSVPTRTIIYDQFASTPLSMVEVLTIPSFIALSPTAAYLPAACQMDKPHIRILTAHSQRCQKSDHASISHINIYHTLANCFLKGGNRSSPKDLARS